MADLPRRAGRDAGRDISSGERGPPHITLSPEEAKVIRECRWNSVVYRGVPAGLISLVAAKAITNRGYFQKFSRLLTSGITGVGFIVGVASYSETCAMKLMSLTNSAAGDRLRDMRKKAGMTITGWDSDVQASTVPGDFEEKEVADDPFVPPLNKRLEESSKWDEIRKQSRQAHSPISSGKGTSYDERRLRNRSKQGDYKSITPEEEDDLERMKQHSLSSEAASFKAKSFSDDKPSSLDFSKSDESSSMDNHRETTDTGGKPKKSYTQGIPSKNKYGDEML